MDEKEEVGITIGLREIYDTVLEVAAGMKNMSERVGKLEEKTADSKEALMKALDAERRLDKIEDHITWLWRTTLGAIILTVVGLWLKGSIRLP